VRRALAAAGIAAALGAGAAAAGPSTGTPECLAGQLSSAFVVVPGSAGAGNISYDLRFRNVSSKRCFVTTVRKLQLFGKTRAPLPTSAILRVPPAGGRVTLAPGGYAAATARFSPDVPGPGEPQTRHCEPTSYFVQATLHNDNTVVGPVAPPTPVCEHGTIALTGIVAGKHGPRS
jgi:Protein of unknown function (DUF4232)